MLPTTQPFAHGHDLAQTDRAPTVVDIIMTDDHPIHFDLERRGERILLKQGVDVRADVLIAGHHGSAGASSATFLSAVAPQWTLIAAGYGNRWNFPARAVRRRLDRQGSEWVATGEAGAVQVRLDPGKALHVVGWRCRSRRYWHLPVECGVKE